MHWKTVLLVCSLVGAGGALTLALLSLLSRRPANLGATGGRLAPCPDSPNCVCSQAEDEAHRIAPLAFTGSPEEAMARARAVMAAWPRTREVTVTDDYVHVECVSLVFRFVDDLELLLDRSAGAIQVRSASRAGRSDLGVNRRRVEALRQTLAAP